MTKQYPVQRFRDLESFLFSFNQYIRGFEEGFRGDESAEEGNPSPVFIIGLQRSGTTLLYQAMARYFRVGYPNNLVARFWRNPCAGIMLSKSILGDFREISFRSSYGNTHFITDPHEFGHFWKLWMGRDPGHPDALTEEELDSVDWDGLRAVLHGMEQCFGMPVLFKQLMLGFQAHRISLEIPGSRFIYIQRPLWEVARSTLKVRRMRYGNDNAWFGLKPPGYISLEKLPPIEQISEQVKISHELVMREMERIEDKRVHRVSFKDFCRKPMEHLFQIQKSLDLEFDITTGIEVVKDVAESGYDATKAEIFALKKMVAG